MDYDHILARIRATLDDGSYLTPIARVLEDDRAALEEVGRLLHDEDVEAHVVRCRIQQLHGAGRLTRTTKLSALGVLAASPKVRDFAEAARLAGQQEFVALEEGGDLRDARLASADRHRGVLAFLMGRPEVALDWFSHAFHREATAENLGNILAAMLRLQEADAAIELVRKAACQLSPEQFEALGQRIETDDDLAALRRHGAKPVASWSA
jgi:tetratricopeptide (TPR) repeat protein